MIRNDILCVILASILGATATVNALGEAPSTNAEVRIEQKLGSQVPLDAVFTDDSGRRVTLGKLVDDRPVVLMLVYYECPMLCNMALASVVSSLKTLSLDARSDYTLVTVSFDPREGPKLAAAAKRTAVHRYGRDGAQELWHFLTGEEPQVKRLADAVGFGYRYDEAKGQYVHAAGVVVLTPAGRVSRYLLGVDYAPRDLQLALVEASDNKIGTLTDQALLLCYQYDPAAGRYGLVIHNVLRVAGVATVLALGSAVAGMIYYERRKLRRAAARARAKE